MNSPVSAENYYRTDDGCVSVNVDQNSSIHLKAISPFNDPIELTAEEARELASVLIKFANFLDDLSA